MQHTATHLSYVVRDAVTCQMSMQHTAAHCNTLQRTARYYNTLQHTAPNIVLKHSATYCKILQHTEAHLLGKVYVTLLRIE